MLFKDSVLGSQYDFGRKIDDSSANLNALCSEIVNRVNDIENMLADGKTIELAHCDNHGNPILLDSPLEEEVYSRTYSAVYQMVYRLNDDTHSAISIHLQKMGIEMPEEGDSSYSDYLQLLYFFYMMRYRIFPGENFFLEFSENHLTSELGPFVWAPRGKYWFFILDNILDDEAARENYIRLYMKYERAIPKMIDLIVGVYSDDFEPDKDILRGDKIEEVCSKIEQYDEGNDESVSPLEKVIEKAYQYQKLSYARDLMENLNPEHNPFWVSDYDIEPNLEWNRVYLQVSEIDDFLKQKDVIAFCKQNNEDIKRPDRAFPANYHSFIRKLIDYDKREVYDDYGSGLFIEVTEGVITIRGMTVAIIMKTLYETSPDYWKLWMKYKQNNEWKNKPRNLKNILVGKNSGKGERIHDIAMKLFYYSYESQYMNIRKGHGIYYLFKNNTIRRYYLIQKLIYTIFSGENEVVWSRRMGLAMQLLSHIV